MGITDISQRIYSTLQKKGYKAADLARHIGTSSGNVSDWKSKNVNPAADKIALISEFLGVSVDFILTGEEKSSPSLRDDELELLRYHNALPELERGKILARLEDKAKEADVLPGRVG